MLVTLISIFYNAEIYFLIFSLIFFFIEFTNKKEIYNSEKLFKLFKNQLLYIIMFNFLKIIIIYVDILNLDLDINLLSKLALEIHYIPKILLIQNFILILIILIFELNKKEILITTQSLTNILCMLMHGLLFAIFKLIYTWDLYIMFFSIEALMTTLFSIIFIFKFSYGINFKYEKKDFIFLIFFVALNGVLSSIFLSSIALFQKYFGVSHILALSAQINVFIFLFFGKSAILQIFWMVFWIFYFFFIKLYFIPFHVIYKKFLCLLPDYLFLVNLLVFKVVYIVVLFKLIYFFHPIIFYLGIIKVFIFLCFLSYCVGTLFMFQEKKIKDFFIYSSLSNNALIVLYFLLNPSITMAMLLALTIYFYIFSVLFIFFFKAFIQKKNIVYFQEFEINWNNILQNKIIYFSFILVFFLLASLAPTIGFLVKYLSFYELFIKYGITWLGLLLPWTFLNALAYLNAFYYIIKSIKREN